MAKAALMEALLHDQLVHPNIVKCYAILYDV